MCPTGHTRVPVRVLSHSRSHLPAVPQMRVSRDAVSLQRLTNIGRQQLKLLLKSLQSKSLLLQPMAHEETNYCPCSVIYRHNVARCPATREATSTAQSRSFARMILFAVLLITHPSDGCFFPLSTIRAWTDERDSE